MTPERKDVKETNQPSMRKLATLGHPEADSNDRQWFWSSWYKIVTILAYWALNCKVRHCKQMTIFRGFDSLGEQFSWTVGGVSWRRTRSKICQKGSVGKRAYSMWQISLYIKTCSIGWHAICRSTNHERSARVVPCGKPAQAMHLKIVLLQYLR